jgi:hypothetical protein
MRDRHDPSLLDPTDSVGYHRPLHRAGPIRLAGSTGSLALAALLYPGYLVAQPSAPPRDFDLVLRPVVVQGGVTAIDVETRYRPAPGTPFVLTAPVVYAGVGGIADRVEGLAVRDGSGTVPLESRDDPPAPGGFPQFPAMGGDSARRWIGRLLLPLTDPACWWSQRAAVRDPRRRRRGQRCRGGIPGAPR